MMEYFVVVFIYKMQQLEIGCVGNIIFFQKYYRQLKKKGSYIHIYTNERRIIPVLVRLRYSCSGTRSLLSVILLFLSLTGGTPRKLVRHHRSGVRKT